MRPTSESDVIKEVAKRLEAAGIGYMITGSVAANFYTIPRMTRDVDIVVELRVEDCDRVFRLFKDDFYADKDAITEAVRKHGMFNCIHLESVVKIDFIVRKDEPYRAEEFGRRIKIIFDGVPLYITAPEDLIISKLYWAKDSMSEMQLNDVRNLMKSVKGLDYDYIESRVERLGVRDAYERVRP